MLIEFSVGNFRSFKEPVALSMVATKAVSIDARVDAENVFSADKNLRLLKSAVIYGANNSGKSNLIDSLRFMRQWVLRSSRDSQVDEPIPVEPFALSEQTLNEPSFFEIVFISQGKQYRYGFRLTSRRVIEEWLYYVPSAREALLFQRHESDIRVMSAFREGKDLSDKTRPNALFLSVVAQFNGAISGQILHWFRDLGIISGLTDIDRSRTEELLDSPEDHARLLHLLKILDLGFDEMRVEQQEAPSTAAMQERATHVYATDTGLLRPGKGGKLARPQATLMTVHIRNDGRETFFDLDKQESEGTKKLVALAGVLLTTLDQGGILIIDELDGRLHPLLTRRIIQLFHSNTANPHNAQLIFATHDTNLLTSRLFRRDQIWFTEKDAEQSTKLYSLVEFKLGGAKVRNDASFEKDYITGRYGAIPFIGDLREFNSMLKPEGIGDSHGQA